jgi:hypothetical protein
MKKLQIAAIVLLLLAALLEVIDLAVDGNHLIKRGSSILLIGLGICCIILAVQSKKD